MEKITIIGGGSWGCGLARILADNNHEVLIYDIDTEAVNEINTYHTNKKKLKEGMLPLSIKATNDLKLAVQANDVILLVVPTEIVRKVVNEINIYINNKKIFINAAKGIEPNTFKRVSQIVYEEINNDFISGFVALTGPSHAEEVILKKLTCVASASLDMNLAKRVQVMFSNKDYFRVYTVNDLVGAELGGSLKNVYALAAGVCAGLGYGVNATAALITRSLLEMKRLAVILGAKEETLNGLTGVGDMIVTCTSKLSRNYQAGFLIGNGSNLQAALNSITMVVEGARTCKSAYQAAQEYHIYTPIINAIYNVIYEQHDPKEEIEKLMANELKDEE